jgi:hypothetical protein
VKPGGNPLAVESFLENRKIGSLPPRMRGAVERAASEFGEQEAAWAAWPEIRDGELWASALALPFLAERVDQQGQEWVSRWFTRLAHRHLRRFQCSTARELRAVRVALSNLQDSNRPS